MRKIGIHEIARLADVSIGTVDRALHSRKGISEKTRQRILTIVKDTKYQPNLAARVLSTSKPTARIGVCIPREIHYFYDQVRQGILAEARSHEHLGVDMNYRPVDRGGEGETERLRELLTSDVQGLILTPTDAKKITPMIDEAEQKGIRVVCVSTDAPGSQRSSVVCVNPRLNGNIAGELMSRFLPPASQVAIVTGMLQVEDHVQKVHGFSETFPRLCRGGKVTEVVEGHDDEDETFMKCMQLLKRGKGLAGVYVSTANCLPVCRAVTVLGRAKQLRLITTDLFPEMVSYFEKGSIVASIYQRPYVQGQRSVRLLLDHIFSGQPLPRHYYLNPGIVLSSNLQLFREVQGTDARNMTSNA
jgi:LacI family transcriptional regulator, galactose operon repressor